MAAVLLIWSCFTVGGVWNGLPRSSLCLSVSISIHAALCVVFHPFVNGLVGLPPGLFWQAATFWHAPQLRTQTHGELIHLSFPATEVQSPKSTETHSLPVWVCVVMLMFFSLDVSTLFSIMVLNHRSHSSISHTRWNDELQIFLLRSIICFF